MKKEIYICDRCGSNIEDTINDLSIIDIHSSPLNIGRLRVELCECCIDDLMQFLYGYKLSDIKVCKPFPGSVLAKEEEFQMQNVKPIVIDFDLKDSKGVKSAELNLEEASKWPPTFYG